MARTPIRVLIVDDEPVEIKGIRALLAEAGDIEVVGEAHGGRMAIELSDRLRPDVLILDLVMPGMDGVEAIRRIMERRADARILVFTSLVTDDSVFPAIRAGALGYLLKNAPADVLVEAIRQVHRGEPHLHPSITRKMLGALGSAAGPKPAPDRLTGREIEVLRLLARGADDQEIAEVLFITEVTVRTHISRILSKLRLDNRVQAALYALREGISSIHWEDGQPRR